MTWVRGLRSGLGSWKVRGCDCVGLVWRADEGVQIHFGESRVSSSSQVLVDLFQR